MENKRIEIFDSTLRDGAQAGNISFTVDDKLNIVKALDDLGVSFIEAGNPSSNPKDIEFFKRANELSLKNAKLVAFGSTRRKGIEAKDDKNVNALLTADTEYVTIFGKSWDFHVTDIIRATLDENLEMIADTISYLISCGKKVMFDAEHFFDGYKANPEYALKSIKTAEKAGACVIILCETNGGCFPDEVLDITTIVCSEISVPVGIHCHNDSGCAEANSIMAVKAGATQVQGTYLGFGERCGNANLSTIIAGIQLKRGYHCIDENNLKQLTKTANYIFEVANLIPDINMPYVGDSAFSHKGGMHVDGVAKNSLSFEHVPPDSVGNERHVLLSEVSGKTAVYSKINDIVPDIEKDSEHIKGLIEELKELEFKGYQFEAAQASFELLVLKKLGRFKPFFNLEKFKIIGEKSDDNNKDSSSAMVKISVGDRFEITADEGDGPVNAIDKALRRAVETFYPNLGDVRLTDYKVRVIDPQDATAAKVRVLIQSTDNTSVWTTVGVSTDVINASLIALVDSIEYKLLKDKRNK